MPQKTPYIILFFLLIYSAEVSSQTIELDLPSCDYLQYHLALKKGNKLDTLSVGRFDETGKASFTLPKEHQSFRGVANLSVRTTGKNWNIILNGEEKISLIEVPDTDDVTFSHSTENVFLVESLAKQNKILGRMGNYQPTNPFSPFVSPKQEYQAFLREIEQSPLYAGRMIELLNILSGLGIESQEQTFAEQQDFIVNKLNYQDLYTSGFWQLTFDTWYQSASLGQEEIIGDSILLSQSRKMLDKTEDIFLRRELTQTFIRQFSKYGKDYLLSGLGSEYLTIPINGKPAPALIDNQRKELKLGKSLLFFYDSDCGNCHQELHQLMDKYALLSNDHNQMRVISISADSNQDTFDYTAKKLPWEDKLCDFKGFDGANFVNYGIVGTPTLILIDDEGIVRGRYARISEFLQN